MRILTVCYEYPPVGGGGGAVCKGVSEAMVRAGHEVDVVTSGMSDLAPYEESNGVRIHRVRCYRPHRHYATTYQLGSFLRPAYEKALEVARDRKSEINHCHFIVPSGLVARKLWKTIGLPYVLTAHGSDVPHYNPDRFELEHRIIRPVWRRVVRDAARVTTASSYLRGLILDLIDVPVQVVHHGYEAASLNGHGRRNILLVASRLFERKGVQDVIRALSGVHTDWELIIAGDGPYRTSLERLAREQAVPAKFLGFMDRRALHDLYQQSRVFVFASTQENFPVVLLEAMAAGCAIVTTSAAGCAEVVGDAAIQVAPGSVRELRTAVQGLLTNEEEIERLGALARERVERFSWPVVASEYENVLQLSSSSDMQVTGIDAPAH